MRPHLLLPLAVLLVGPTARAVTLDAVTLPAAEPTASSLLATPAELATLQARRTTAPFQAQFQATRSFVDGRLAALNSNPAGQGDDTLSKVAKAAGLLHFLGETPPSTFTTYADVVVKAIRGVGSRDPGNPVFPPSNAIDVLQDSSRLQSMVEGYDFVRASLAGGDNDALRAVIGDWAEALRNDLNLTGALGISGHRDNWGVKAGAVLVECALAMPRAQNASNWLNFGKTLLAESLAKVSDDQGWYRESPHYLNYSLANLFTAAIAVKKRTGVDWFDDLAAFARLALDMRQPDGWSVPFEEGVSATFPFDVFASQLPALAPQLQWAWTNSTKDATNFENQAFHAVTRFLFLSDVAAEPPPAPTTRFADGPAHVHVLRSAWDADALQLTAITAVDHANTTTVASRHNLQNPLDFVLYGKRRLLVATSGGGPTVTTSGNRDYYLKASSRNVPLIGGNAPYIVDAAKIRSEHRLDTTWADAARTVVTAYPNATVRRTWLQLDDAESFVADEIDANNSVEIALPLRPRGTRTMRSSGPGAIDGTWAIGDARLDLFATATPDVTAANTAGFTSPTWNVEEPIQGIELKARTNALRSLTRLAPRLDGETGATVERLQATSGAALRVSRGAVVDLVASGSASAGDLVFDGALVVVRKTDGVLTGLVVVGGKSVTVGGTKLFESTEPVTLAVKFATDGLVLTTTRDGSASFTLSNVLPAGAWAKVSGGGTLSQQGNSLVFSLVPASSTVTVGPGHAPELTLQATYTGREGETLQLQPAVSDADGSFTVAVDGLPGGAQLDAITGLVSWTPGFDVSSRTINTAFPMTFHARDGFHDVTATTTLTILNVNGRPTLSPNSTVTATRGEEVVVELYATDPDNDALTFEVRESAEISPKPTVSGNPASLRWTPGANVPVGTWSAEIEVSDGELSSVATVSFRVVEPPYVDAGTVETPDAGTPDAGSDVPEVPTGCGCGGGADAMFVALPGLALLRRRRSRTS